MVARPKVERTSREDLPAGSITNAQCSACKNVFSNTRNFDAHRRWSVSKEESYCVEPTSVKLMLNAKGLYITASEWFKDSANG